MNVRFWCSIKDIYTYIYKVHWSFLLSIVDCGWAPFAWSADVALIRNAHIHSLVSRRKETNTHVTFILWTNATSMMIWWFFIYGQKGNCKQVFDVASELLLLLLCGECFTSSLADGALWFKQRGLNKHTQNTPISNINMYVYIYCLVQRSESDSDIEPQTKHKKKQHKRHYTRAAKQCNGPWRAHSESS